MKSTEHQPGKPDLDLNKKRRNTGRTKLPDPRVHSVHPRLSDNELTQLDSQRGPLGRGEYMRMATLHKLPSVIPHVNRLQWAGLARVGSNLNQLATAYNVDEDGLIRDIHTAKQVLFELRKALISARDTLINTPVVPISITPVVQDFNSIIGENHE